MVCLLPGIVFSQDTRKADKWFEGGAYYKAMEEYCRLVAENRGQLRQAKVEFRVGVCCMRMNRYSHALEWLERAEKNGYMGKDLYGVLGDAYLITAQYEKAKVCFERYREQAPEDKKCEAKITSCEFAMAVPAENPDLFIESLPYINTRGSEYGISFVSGGLLYSSTGDLLPEKKSEVSQRTGMGFSQPYLSVLRNGEYQPGQLLKGLQKPGANEGAFSFDVVNERLYCTRCEEGLVDCHIIEAQLKGQTYRHAKILKMEGKRYNIAHPFITVDGNRIYFSSTMPGGYGGADIWYVDRTSRGRWGKPQNAGAAVNTPGNEVFPYVWMGWLFFASDGHIGYGGLDLYRIHLQDRDAGGPENLGAGFNTSYDDFNLIMHSDGKGGLLVSNRTAGRSDDIYRFELSKPVETIKNKPGSLITAQLQSLPEKPENTPKTGKPGSSQFQIGSQEVAEAIKPRKEIELTGDSDGVKKTYRLEVETGDVIDAGWWVQVAMLMEAKVIHYDLASRITKLTGRNIVMYRGEDGGHRFYIGVYKNEREARDIVSVLKRAGIDCFIKRVKEE